MQRTTLKKLILLILFIFITTSCNGWTIQPLPNNPTPFVLPTRTPAIFSPTPVIVENTLVAANTPTFLPTNTQPATPTEVPLSTPPPTSIINEPALQILVLGCNTGIDITHGMGEVTNAYVTLKNIGNVDLTNLVAILYALDEGREHPDKIQEIALLPVTYEVTLKMTVDSTYRQESPIQIEVSSDQKIFPREGLASCRDIGLFAPKPENLTTPVPRNP